MLDARTTRAAIHVDLGAVAMGISVGWPVRDRAHTLDCMRAGMTAHGHPRRRSTRDASRGMERSAMAKPWVDIGRYGGVGIELVLTILILGGVGHWLDTRYWGASGWGSGVGFLLGVAVGFRNLMRTAAHMQRDGEGQPRPGKPGR